MCGVPVWINGGTPIPGFNAHPMTQAGLNTVRTFFIMNAVFFAASLLLERIWNIKGEFKTCFHKIHN